jgi:hypothetical protein
MKTWEDRFIDALHERVGICGHCGKSACPERKSYSTLPDTIRLDDVLSALTSAQPKTGTKR